MELKEQVINEAVTAYLEKRKDLTRVTDEITFSSVCLLMVMRKHGFPVSSSSIIKYYGDIGKKIYLKRMNNIRLDYDLRIPQTNPKLHEGYNPNIDTPEKYVKAIVGILRRSWKPRKKLQDLKIHGKTFWDLIILISLKALTYFEVKASEDLKAAKVGALAVTTSGRFVSRELKIKNPISKPIIHQYALIKITDEKMIQPIKQMNIIFHSNSNEFYGIIYDIIGSSHEHIYLTESI